ncbi:MAG: response regulator receiver protein [Segetibacter sp.]|jgi:CheY-like chemotaxis protein|nr:response regulator receiver protein [Segetibacter sp.]
MKKIKILIAENDEDEQTFMKDGFEGSGYFEVIGFAESGDQLLTLLNENEACRPDVILSDLNMPGKTGYDILTELRADDRFYDLPIVITSTSSVKSVIETCMRLGATSFIQKPDTFVEYASFAKALAVKLQEQKTEG